MEAIYIIKNGKPEIAFERRKINLSPLKNDEVSIEVEAFGLNFADVVARLGMYRDCPPLPTVVGYEVVGRIIGKGEEVQHVNMGDRVVAFTIFGGYATHVNTNAKAVVKIPDDYNTGKALALAVQYCTAYYASHIATNVLEKETVLIQAAAGGVGTALTQLCKLKGCKIYGTAGSEEKLQYLKKQGVDYPINYRKQDFSNEIKEKVDVVFDSIGGKSFKKGLNLLNYGGRMVAFGAASQLEAGNFFKKVKFGLSFGFYHPAMFIMNSKTLAGVNMLKIGIHKPDILQYCMQNVVKLAEDGKIDPYVGQMFPVEKLNEAHTALENRATKGKVGVYW
ncbi:MAG: zinc-binding dehydrogenase [Bacteroidales bacterium]|nr:zinc-binding dehydrogenase [Bacteroidales bacterium]